MINLNTATILRRLETIKKNMEAKSEKVVLCSVSEWLEMDVPGNFLEYMEDCSKGFEAVLLDDICIASEILYLDVAPLLLLEREELKRFISLTYDAEGYMKEYLAVVEKFGIDSFPDNLFFRDFREQMKSLDVKGLAERYQDMELYRKLKSPIGRM